MLDLDLSGGVVYAVGCHGGLPVPGVPEGEDDDEDHSRDLPQTFLSLGVLAYIANTGFGYGLEYGIGYGERLVQIFTEELSRGGTQAVGEAVNRTKLRYQQETPRFDQYDAKSLMQWTLFGLPMYAVRAIEGPGSAPVRERRQADGTEAYGPVQVTRQMVEAGQEGIRPLAPEPLPDFLTQLNLHFNFSGPHVYQKWSAQGGQLDVPGCPDELGCYYTLNGLVERSTGGADLPIQPYFIYDSRLSGTSQHGVLWKGGQYREETGWIPVIAQLASNVDSGDDNHGVAPQTIKQRSTSARVVPGADPPDCRVSDVEINSVVVDAGEALKPTGSDSTYDPELYTIQRTYRTVELEVFYFNDRENSNNNCDRIEPRLRPSQEVPFSGKYHRREGDLLHWRVLARDDDSDIWRVIVVVTDNTVVAGQGRWEAVELTRDGTEDVNGTPWTAWKGSKHIGNNRATYVVQAVDNRGNVAWLTYQSATMPTSGVPLGVAETVEVVVTPGAIRRRTRR
jgi:hypothetical protein